MSVSEQIAEIANTTSGSFNPLHEVTDRDKVSALAADMAVHGWTGAPIVVDSENAFTGVHRIAAATHLWNAEGIEVPIPFVEISDLCNICEIDWSGLVFDEYDGDTYQAAAALRALLPREIVDYLGFDVDGTL